jgi:hypothetical protein
MQPALLLDGLDALKRAYQRDRRAGEEMFDLLIAFLRAAMPGLRSGSSTVAAELTLVDRYTALREALDADALPWRLTLSEPPPDLAFPPLRLLPALDRLSRGAPRGAALEVTAAAKEGAFVIRIAVPAETPLSPALIDELRGGLRRDLGVNSLTAGDPRDPILAELRIHTQNPSAPAIFA